MSAIPFFPPVISTLQPEEESDLDLRPPSFCKKNIMALEYDEIRITTRREIDICRSAIKKLESSLAAMEEKYGRTSADLMAQMADSTRPADLEIQQWYDNCLALQSWRQRLAGHRRIMLM